jgi:serine/threonine-protein kinase
VGQRFNAGGRRYELMGKIGDGAAGLVRKAKDLETGQTVAIKILAPDPKYIDIAVFDDVEQRFKREGLRGSVLRDVNLIEIIAYESNDDGSRFEGAQIKNPFIVMEYIKGGTLESLIRNIRTSTTGSTHITKQTLSVASGVASALRYLHDRKVVHRDVKPANIFVSETTVDGVPSFTKLGDFGVMKWGDFLATAASGTLTVTMQQGLGTLKYMSPEQAVRPKEVTVRSDMFSLGITLFELFTGRILPSPHHVFEIMSARGSRDSIIGKLHKLGLHIPYEHAHIFELVLDMFLTSPKGRPNSTTVAGRMAVLLERFSPPS